MLIQFTQGSTICSATERLAAVYSDAKLCILAILLESPLTLDQLRERIHSSRLDTWFRIGNFSLEKHVAALISSGELCVDGDAYVISEAGNGVVHTALCERLSDPDHTDASFNVALASIDVLKPAVVSECLVKRILTLNLRIVQAKSQIESGQATSQERLLYDRALIIAEADLAWSQAFMAQWVLRYPAALPAHQSDEFASPATLVHRSTRPVSPVKHLQRIPKLPTAD